MVNQVVSFCSTVEYEKYVSKTKSSCLITSVFYEDTSAAQILVKDPYAAFAVTAQQFFRAVHSRTGINDKAFISETAKVSEKATLYPNVYVDEGAVIEEGAVLYPGVFMSRNAKVGKDSVLRANVVLEFDCIIGVAMPYPYRKITIIGADGFGFAPGKGKLEKIPQTGNVIIHDHVELGAGCSVDRATMGSTIIGEGSKIDSFTQIGHNVNMGKHNIVCGGAALAGSCSTGNFVVIGGASNVGNHVHLRNRGVRIELQNPLS